MYCGGGRGYLPHDVPVRGTCCFRVLIAPALCLWPCRKTICGPYGRRGRVHAHITRSRAAPFDPGGRARFLHMALLIPMPRRRSDLRHGDADADAGATTIRPFFSAGCVCRYLTSNHRDDYPLPTTTVQTTYYLLPTREPAGKKKEKKKEGKFARRPPRRSLYIGPSGRCPILTIPRYTRATVSCRYTVTAPLDVTRPLSFVRTVI